MTEPRIGFISGTGPQGRGLAMRLAMAGCDVIVGSRQSGRAEATTEELNRIMEAHGGGREFSAHRRG